MSYTKFIKNTPVGTQKLHDFAASFRENGVALIDSMIWGAVPCTASAVMVQVGGTAPEPATQQFTLDSTETIYTDFAWSSNKISTITFSWSPTTTGGTSIQTAGTATFVYSSNELSSINNAAGGMFLKLYQLLWLQKSTKDSFDGHTGATYSSNVHGMGTLAGQNIGTIFLTGGTMLGVTVNSLKTNVSICKEKFYSYGAFTGGQTAAIALTEGGYHELTLTGSSAGSPLVINTSGSDLNPYANLTQSFILEIIIPQYSSDQYVSFSGYYWIALAQTQFSGSNSAISRHLFSCVQRGAGGISLKFVNYLGAV